MNNDLSPEIQPWQTGLRGLTPLRCKYLIAEMSRRSAANGRRHPLSAAALISVVLYALPAVAKGPRDRPWDDARVSVVIDPYYANDIDWDRAASDPRLKAVIHKASDGHTADPKFLTRANEARARGLLYGAYHLGRPGDPIPQADLFVQLADRAHVRFLALDLEGEDPSKFMTLPDAQRFMEHVAARTGRYPTVYVNLSVYKSISAQYDRRSTFAKGPLWIARFRPQLDLTSRKVWDDYTLWQFSSEINCKPKQPCLYRVPGTASDMDLNVWRGDEASLKRAFQ